MKNRAYYQSEQNPDAPEIWTKEARRVEQITDIEDKINQYKELGEWGYVLNKCEDYLRFQVEAIEEKDPSSGKKMYGIETPTYKAMMEEINLLMQNWDEAQMKMQDPAARSNNAIDRREIIMRIKGLIDRLYHNNIVFNLTYRKKKDPMEAWKE